MITVGMNYKVVTGKDEEFIAVFTKVLQIINDLPGHGETHLYRDVHHKHDYLIISEWSDEAAFNAFIASDRFKKVADWGKRNILTQRPRHEIYGGTRTSQPPGERCPAGS